jgi:hypothetical protein
MDGSDWDISRVGKRENRFSAQLRVLGCRRFYGDKVENGGVREQALVRSFTFRKLKM